MSCVLHSISLSVFAVTMQLIAKDRMFVCLHGKKRVSTLLLNRRNTHVSTRRSVDDDQLKITLVYTVIHAIFLDPYIAINKGFFGLSEPGRVRQGIGLWYFSRLIRCLLFNRYFLTENMSDLFYLYKIKQASHLPMSNSCDTDQTAHRHAHNHKI